MKKTKKSSITLENVPPMVIALALAALMFAILLMGLAVYTAIVAVVKEFPEIAAMTFSLPMIVITAAVSLTVFTVVKIGRIKKSCHRDGFREGRRFEQEQQENARIAEPQAPENCYREVVYLNPNRNRVWQDNSERVATSSRRR